MEKIEQKRLIYNLMETKKDVKMFCKEFEFILLDRVMDESLKLSDIELYLEVCNKYHINPSSLILEIKNNNKYHE
jgi:hypothetical protein